MAFDALAGLLFLSSTVFIIVAPTFGQMYGGGPMPHPVFGGPHVPMFPPNNMMNANFLSPQPQMFLRPVNGPFWNRNFIRQPWMMRRIAVRPTHFMRRTHAGGTGGLNHINRPVVAQPPKQQTPFKPVSPKPTQPKKQSVLNYVRPHPKPIFPMSHQKKGVFRGIAKAKNFHRLIRG